MNGIQAHNELIQKFNLQAVNAEGYNKESAKAQALACLEISFRSGDVKGVESATFLYLTIATQPWYTRNENQKLSS